MADAIYDTFVERLIDRARTITVGDPLDPATDLGPVISAVAQDRILRYIASGNAEGARLVFGGGRPAGPQFVAASSGRTPSTSTPRRSSSTSTCPAGSIGGPTRCSSALRRPERPGPRR